MLAITASLLPEVDVNVLWLSITWTAAAEDKWHPPLDHRDQYAQPTTAAQRPRHASADIVNVLTSPEMSSIGSYLVFAQQHDA